MATEGLAETLGKVFDSHVAAEFEAKDLAGAMATMSEEPVLLHVPVITGGRGRRDISDFYRDHFIPAWPDDVEVELVSRTATEERVVDELIVRFTHTRVMDFWLPGVAPTWKRVELPHVAVVGFEGDKISYEHIYWDQASLLVQIGLLQREGLPVTGAEQARALRDPGQEMNQLLDREG